MLSRGQIAKPILLLMSVALAGVFVARSDAGPPPPPPFSPTYVPAVVSPVAGAHTDTTIQFSLPAGDFNFSAVISFLPDDAGVGTCAANSGGASLAQACADDMIPNGALIGQVVADSTLGVLNANCNQAFDGITWTMMEATTNMATQVMFEDDPLDVADPGSTGDKGEQFEDDDADGIPNGVEMYPAYLSRLIYGPQPFGVPGSAPLQPMLRSYGQANVANTDVSLQFVLMPPGITINGVALPSAAGYSLITVLQNTGDPGALSTPQGITDSCSPLNSLSTTYGVTRDNSATPADEGGITLLTAPSAGTYEAHALLFSNRDQDADGVENQMDTCPLVANAGDPTVLNSGDADGDGLDSACDPNDASFDQDQDGDTFVNRGDNCPTTSNNADLATAQDDIDRDGIGDVCDPAPTTPSPLLNVFPQSYAVNGSTFLANVVVTGPVMGDTNCAAPIGTVNSIDALQVLRRNASSEPYGACANNAEADVDCSGVINAIDALKILRHSAGLSVVQIGPEPDACTNIGTALP